MLGRVLLQRDGPLAWVTLDHTGKFNAMSRAMWRQLREAFDALRSDSMIRCVVVRGEGGHFCAGGDIAEYPGFRFDSLQLQSFHEEDVWGALQAMLDCDLPLVAQIEGNCMGAGLEIASCCDLRLAADNARFGAPIARLGFPMAPKEAALVGRAVGATTARAMLLAAELFDASHMHTHGFLTQVVAQDQLAQRVQALTERMATLAPQTARLHKQTLRALDLPAHPEAMPTLAQTYAYADSPEHREGISAFLEKRKPLF